MPSARRALLPDPHRRRTAGPRALYEHAAAVADAHLGAEGAQQRPDDDDVVTARPAVVGCPAVGERLRPEERVQFVYECGIQQRLREIGVGGEHAEGPHYLRSVIYSPRRQRRKEKLDTTTSCSAPLTGGAPLFSHRFRWVRSRPARGTLRPA